MKKDRNSNPVALVPILVFLVLYLGTGIIFEYVMKIPMGFYNVPIIVAFMAAILVACMQNSQLKFDEKLDVMAKGLADRNIVTMLLIFITAGIFVGVVGRSSAESVAYFMLSLIPDIATANNTVAIVMANPIAVEMSEEYGITHSKAASLLDTFSCISQGVIPYGAQMLVALSAIHEMGHELSAFDVIPKLFYPGLLLVSSLIFIFIIPQKKVS